MTSNAHDTDRDPIPPRTNRHRRASRRGLRWLRIVVVVVVALIVIAVAAFAGTIYAVSRHLPNLDALRPLQNAVNTTLYDNAGKVIVQIHGSEDRVLVKGNQISPWMKKATVAAEDRRFYHHHGIDFQGLARAMFADLKAGALVQGGSTITEQFIKNAYIGNERSVTRKLREAVLAWQLEDKWNKDQILTAYLNTVYYGDGAYGVEAASWTYFHKPAKRLSLSQAALLAAIPRLPSDYTPLGNTKSAAFARRDLILDLMVQQGDITQAQADAAKAARFAVYSSRPAVKLGVTAYFVRYVEDQLINKLHYSPAQVFGGGLRVFTSLNAKDENAAYRVIQKRLGYKGAPAAVLDCVDPTTGYIRAMVGGLNYKNQQYTIAYGPAGRQAGSSFKPYTLTAAVLEGMDPYSTYYNSYGTKDFPTGYGRTWTVHGDGLGRITVADAIRVSDNTVFAQLCMDVGPYKVADTAHLMGIQSPLDPVPSLTLGTSSVNVLEMADAYGTLASGGIRHDPKAIVRVVLPSGKVDYRAKITGTRALPAGVASVVNSALSAVPRWGTGSAVSSYISRACAGKTGTTDLNTDAWYVGYTPNLVAGIWIGNADGTPTALGNSTYVAGNYCAPIWGEFMQTALQGLPALDFQTAYWPFMPWKGHWSTVSPSPSPSPSKSPSKSPKPTPTPTKTIVGPSPSPSPSPSKSPSPSPSPSPTKSP